MTPRFVESYLRRQLLDLADFAMRLWHNCIVTVYQAEQDSRY